MKKHILKNEKTSMVLIFSGILLIVFAIITFLWMDFDFNINSPINSGKFGQFGDFIGGIVGSLWALAGVLLFYIALNEQRKDFKTNKETLKLQIETLNQQVKEFKLQRKELVSSRKVYEQQSKTLKTQQFESNFYSLLNVYLSIKDKLNNLDKNQDFFKEFYEELSINYLPDIDIVSHHNNMVDSYTKLFNKQKGYLSHYFKTLYRIIKIIDSNNILVEQEKVFYSKILRSQFTDYEQLVLYYNSHSVYGLKSRPLILKYNILKHTPIFNKPEFEFFLNIHKNNNLLFFADYLKKFVTKHINDSFDISFDKDQIVEKFDIFDCLIGIYFFEKIEVKIICKKDISQNKINMTENQFACFVHLLLSDIIIFNTYIVPKEITLSKFITKTDDNKIIGVSIDTEAKLSLNYDKF